MIVAGLTIVAAIVTYKLYKDQKVSKFPLPPGPKSYPVIGHLLSIPKEYEHLGFAELGKQLNSDIISLTVFGQTLVLLNKREDVINLLEKRSATYSDRTCPLMASNPSLLDWGNFVSLVGYGDRWRRYRRLMSPWLTKKAVTAFEESQERAAMHLLQRLLKDNNSKHLKSSISAALTNAIYGHEPVSSSDNILVRSQTVFSYLSKCLLPSNYYVNTFPILMYIPEWFPGASWKRDVNKWKREKVSFLSDTYQLGLENMMKDESKPIMLASLRNQALKLGLTQAEVDDHVAQLAVTLFSGGTDTTVDTLLIFFLAMVLNPEVQKRAQEELDLVLGGTRLPGFRDRAQLGCIERIVQETLRWNPTTPVAFPHTCFRDDVYKGYFIPKGAIVAMTRDEQDYKLPETFNPDRFLDASTPPSPLFGWGRRRCPGVHFAESSLFITVASILMVFNIKPAQDEGGNDILPSQRMTNSIVVAPEPFTFRLIPRSDSHKELVPN
ncbi:cytochrome P450 family protein [Rhizoctonia solani AG-3 Rhs1AP]|uniref:Cytochrome P450 family protein n=1 Tax=Rhizoctonia solani AG-3 Rhs1AP TaxID=1086054 RepID=X8J2A0_9AGAM|nr:cytochrome P450 family protein [Rhizoctonia solani AG-3 Rhs1AP]